MRILGLLVAGSMLFSPAGTRADDTLATHGDLQRRDGDSSETESSGELGTRVASKVAVYTDDDGLTVITPIISVTQKIHDRTSLSAEYDADVLSAATVDVRTAATDKFEEVRHGLALSATHRVRSWETDLTGAISLSREADYASATFSGGFASDFLEKNVTVGAGYSYVINAVGRAKTPFSNFLDTLHIHAISLSLTQILSPRTYFQLSGSAIGAFGYQGSVYRYVPLFLEGQVDPADVSETSLESGGVHPLYRPAEQVPRTRYRGAAVARVNHAFPFRLTLSADYRFYADSWAVTSHTADVSAYQRLPLGLILRLRNRFYYQTSASFYQRVYTVASPGELPELYTTDRELGTFWYDLVGLKLAIEVPVSPTFEKLVLDVKGDLQFTKYLDFAYLPDRMAVVFGAGLLVEL